VQWRWQEKVRIASNIELGAIETICSVKSYDFRM